MLYPKEIRNEKTLLYGCRNCDHQEVANDSCVYRNTFYSSSTRSTSAARSVSGLCEDPTLPRTNKRPCPMCHGSETVFFQSHDRRRDTPMTLNFVCCNSSCNYVWND